MCASSQDVISSRLHIRRENALTVEFLICFSGLGERGTIIGSVKNVGQISIFCLVKQNFAE